MKFNKFYKLRFLLSSGLNHIQLMQLYFEVILFTNNLKEIKTQHITRTACFYTDGFLGLFHISGGQRANKGNFIQNKQTYKINK